jgi:putative membrane protein
MLIGIIVIWVITAAGLWLTIQIVPGVQTRSTGGLWLAALVLGLVNAFIRPVLWIFTLPLTVLTFGLFALVINAFMIWLTARLVSDFEVRDFTSAILAALVMALLGLFAFMLMEWLMLGSVHWITMEQHGYIGPFESAPW